MNDRIGRIAADALDASVPETYTFLDQDKLTRFADEFAHRIIQECCEVAHCNFHVDGLTLGGIIKKHFGVEE